MKTLELNTLPTPVLLVWGLPEDAKVTDNNAISHRLPKCGVMHYTHLPEGNWQLIGKLSELTEEQAKGLVDYFTTDDDFGNEDVFRDYLGKAFCDTALESFHSAIEAEGYYVENPIPFPRSDIDGTFLDDYEIREYTSAQSKTLPGSTLIFKRA